MSETQKEPTPDSRAFLMLAMFQRVETLANLVDSEETVSPNLLSYANEWFSEYRRRVRTESFPALNCLSDKAQQMYWKIRSALSIKTLSELCFFVGDSIVVNIPAKEATHLIEFLEDLFASIFLQMSWTSSLASDAAILVAREEQAIVIKFMASFIDTARKLEAQRMKTITLNLLQMFEEVKK